MSGARGKTSRQKRAGTIVKNSAAPAFGASRFLRAARARKKTARRFPLLAIRDRWKSFREGKREKERELVISNNSGPVRGIWRKNAQSLGVIYYIRSTSSSSFMSSSSLVLRHRTHDAMVPAQPRHCNKRVTFRWCGSAYGKRKKWKGIKKKHERKRKRGESKSEKKESGVRKKIAVAISPSRTLLVVP